MSSFRILSTGSYAPDNIVTNSQLSEMLDTTDQWIQQRVGICQRHISVSETTSDMAAKAAENALQNSGVRPEDLDMIICATITAEYRSPNLACMVQKKLGASCPAMDVNCACSSFIYALDTAAGFFARGTVRHILVVGAERLSSIVDWKDRSTAVIFGDGAGAVLLGTGDNYLASVLNAAGNDEIIKIPDQPENSFISMKGQETFQFAVKSICADLQTVIKKAGLQPEDIDYIIPHQANSRIIEFAQKRLNIPAEKFCMNIKNYGNTSSASIPMLLDELNRSGKLEQGDKIALCAFGGGLSSGACIITW